MEVNPFGLRANLFRCDEPVGRFDLPVMSIGRRRCHGGTATAGPLLPEKKGLRPEPIVTLDHRDGLRTVLRRGSPGRH